MAFLKITFPAVQELFGISLHMREGMPAAGARWEGGNLLKFNDEGLLERLDPGPDGIITTTEGLIAGFAQSRFPLETLFPHFHQRSSGVPNVRVNFYTVNSGTEYAFLIGEGLSEAQAIAMQGKRFALKITENSLVIGPENPSGVVIVSEISSDNLPGLAQNVIERFEVNPPGGEGGTNVWGGTPMVPVVSSTVILPTLYAKAKFVPGTGVFH